MTGGMRQVERLAGVVSDRLTEREADALEGNVGYVPVRLTTGGHGVRVLGPRTGDLGAARRRAADAAAEMPGVTTAVMTAYAVYDCEPKERADGEPSE